MKLNIQRQWVNHVRLTIYLGNWCALFGIRNHSALSLPQSLDPVRRLHATDKPAFVKPSDEPFIVGFSSVRLADVAAGSVAPISALLPQS
jgi:hypothetical protein